MGLQGGVIADRGVSRENEKDKKIANEMPGDPAGEIVCVCVCVCVCVFELCVLCVVFVCGGGSKREREREREIDM